jgi:TetR/AcrR family tetracycline transcriptional repressor
MLRKKPPHRMEHSIKGSAKTIAASKSRPRVRSTKLDHHAIIETALKLLDDKGLEGFQMRALGERLHVQASALYWHVGDKSELVSHMARTFYDKAVRAAPTDSGWRPWLTGYGRAFRRALLDHRDSARLCASAKPVEQNPRAAADALAAPLVAAGLDRRTALSYHASVISLTLGWAIYEQSSAMHDHLLEIINFDRSFEIGLLALVNGFPEPHARNSMPKLP